MARLCERPTCKREGTVVYGFDAVRLEVWFESPQADQGSRVRYGVLCKEHADRMTVPLGWHLDDRRQRVQQLFRGIPGGASDDASGERVHRRHRQRTSTRSDATTPMVGPSDETLSLFALDEPVAVAPVIEPEPVAAIEPESEPEPVLLLDPSEPIDRTDDDRYSEFSEYNEYDGMDPLLDEDRLLLDEGF